MCSLTLRAFDGSLIDPGVASKPSPLGRGGQSLTKSCFGNTLTLFGTAVEEYDKGHNQRRNRRQYDGPQLVAILNLPNFFGQLSFRLLDLPVAFLLER